MQAKKNRAGARFFHCKDESERQVHVFQVFACFHQHQGAFVQDHGRWTLTGHTHRLGFCGNRSLHRSDFGSI